MAVNNSPEIEEIESDEYSPGLANDLPGFGQPIDHVPTPKRVRVGGGPANPEAFPQNAAGDNLFINALCEEDTSERESRSGRCYGRLMTLRELGMMSWMNTVTDKQDWDVKVFDETVVAKWKAETLSSPDRNTPGFTEAMFDWCIAELRWKSPIYEESGAVAVYEADVVKSDKAIPEHLREVLSAAVKDLERNSELHKDWHPFSDEKVLDLVHPSLFSLVYGRSRILPDSLVGLDDCIDRSGEGQVSPLYPNINPLISATYSKKFQWLPCNVDIRDGVKITSYINNLHPDNKQLYGIIEQIIDKTIPLWNATLTPLKAQSANIRRESEYVRIEYAGCEYEDIPEEIKPQREPTETEDEFDDRYMEWEDKNRVVKQPDPEAFQPPAEVEEKEKVDLRRDYSHSGLQVIVKLANIHLTPEKPTYDGGSWHVEGQLNEHICASAIYYHSSHNITDSQLYFRHRGCSEDLEELGYEQDHHDWLPQVFGCEQNEPTLQELGSVSTTQGRLLTFPNTLQHLVSPFKLTDHKQPGYRKILALFLVDPNMKIISTANVPCQRRDWWADATRLQSAHGRNRVAGVPNELWDMIVDKVDEFPISMEEAKELRLELMKERTGYSSAQRDRFASEVFSLCEH